MTPKQRKGLCMLLMLLHIIQILFVDLPKKRH